MGMKTIDHRGVWSKRLFKWFRSHPWYEQIIMGIPATIITLLIAWFIFTAIVFGILYAIDFKGDRTHSHQPPSITQHK